MLLLVGAGYAAYRVDRFSHSAFRDERLPDELVAPRVTATAALEDTRPAAVAVTSTPVVAIAPTIGATAAPTPTRLPYGAARLTQRLQEGQRFTVLLLGLAGPGHNAAYLTDSLQVLSFAPKTGTATLISVPRDLWVSVPQFEGRGGAWRKINEAYQVGMGPVDRDDPQIPYTTHAKGGQVASKVVEQVLGLPIDAWVSLDFVGFQQFIDALGGVDVDVERGFTDTRYPANDDPSIDAGYTTIRFEAGCQHMDGARAMTFVRSRYAPKDGSDFGRAQRQQRLLAALQHQLFRVTTIPKALALLGALEDHVHTSLSRREAQDLAGWLQGQADKQRSILIQRGGLDTAKLLFETRSPQGAYVLVPKHGRADYREIRRYVQNLLEAPATPRRDAPATQAPATPRRGAQASQAPAASTSAPAIRPCGR
jgi:LCP family protein required for cell wall assembly